MPEPFETIDYGDLADVVQQLRMIGFRAYLGPAKLGIHVPWFEDLHEFPSYIAELRLLAETCVGERAQEAAAILAEVERVHEALKAGPRRPEADEVVARFVGGEIGDRTAQYVMGWDAWQLIDECRKRGLPPFQDIDDGEIPPFLIGKKPPTK
jgi:hypothetical protein